MAITVDLFTTCKPFVGEAITAQVNALSSWHALNLPITICGNEPGTAEAAKRFNANHILEIDRTASGMPIVKSIFAEAVARSDAPYLAYVNSDILLTPAIVDAISRILAAWDETQPILVSFRRRNIPVIEEISGSANDITNTVKTIDNSYGCWDQSNAIDFFLFNRDLFDEMPPLVIGHMLWDNWLLWKAVDRGATIIDASPSAALFHPIHGYASDGTGLLARSQNPLAMENRRLADGNSETLTTASTHALVDGKIMSIDDELTAEISKRCAPDTDREFKAGLVYLKGSLELRTASEILDCCRTILWRQHRFYPLLEETSPDNATLRSTIKQASDLCDTNQLTEAIDLIEQLIAAPLLERLRNAQASDIKLFIWGCGGYGSRLLSLLRRQNIKVNGFLDRHASQGGGTVDKLPVIGYDPEDARKEGPCHIIIGSMYAGEISTNFDSKGLERFVDYSG